MRYIAHELKYTLCDRKFWFSVFGMMLISLFCLSNERELAPDNSVYYFYSVYQYYPLWRMILIFAAIPGATGFCIDWNSEAYRLKVIRGGKKGYVISRITACIVSAFLVALFSQIGMLMVLALRHPLYLEGDGRGVLAGGIYEKWMDADRIWLYFLNRIMLQALGVAFFSLVGLFISIKIPDVLVTVTAPIICYYLIENVTAGLDIPVFLSVPGMLRGNLEFFKSLGFTWLYMGIFWGILIIVVGILIYRNCKRRIENG